MWNYTLFYYLKIKLFSDWLRIVFTAALSPLFIRYITLMKGNTMRYLLVYSCFNIKIFSDWIIIILLIIILSVRCRHSVRFWTKCRQEEFLCRHSVRCRHSVLDSINFDIQTNFKVNRPKSAILSPKILQKITKKAISQNPILPKCHSPKSILLLHFSMKLSETFKINVNMDFAHTNFSRFLI